jgi:CPA2 family monovalent cation:H+ antiporter-2
MLALADCPGPSPGIILAIMPALKQGQALAPTVGLRPLEDWPVFGGSPGPRALGRASLTSSILPPPRSSELFLLSMVALCLGVAWVTAQLGLSIERGRLCGRLDDC